MWIFLLNAFWAKGSKFDHSDSFEFAQNSQNSTGEGEGRGRYWILDPSVQSKRNMYVEHIRVSPREFAAILIRIGHVVNSPTGTETHPDSISTDASSPFNLSATHTLDLLQIPHEPRSTWKESASPCVDCRGKPKHRL